MGRSTTVAANTDLAARFVAEVGGGPAVWLGNSMGGLITLVAAGRHPEVVSGVVLVNPALMPRLSHRRHPLTMALFAAYLTPGVGRAVVAGRRRVRTPEQTAMDTMRLCCGDPLRVDDAVVRAHVEVLERRAGYPGVEEEFVAATRSLISMLARRRQVSALADAVSVPVLMLHGGRDRLVPLATAVELASEHPDWSFAVAAGVGHVPQLEVPDWTATRIRCWLDGEGAVAAQAARPMSLSR
jgi:pimeloyl-ACP methyl ester carboxylesterase